MKGTLPVTPCHPSTEGNRYIIPSIKGGNHLITNHRMNFHAAFTTNDVENTSPSLTPLPSGERKKLKKARSRVVVHCSPFTVFTKKKRLYDRHLSSKILYKKTFTFKRCFLRKKSSVRYDILFSLFLRKIF